MFRRSLSRWFASSLALLAIASNALWPLLAQANPGRGGTAAAEICTSAGIRSMAAGGDVPHRGGGPLMAHCDFCPTGADRASLPESISVSPAVVALEIDTLTPPEPRPATAVLHHFPALPRAPPAHS